MFGCLVRIIFIMATGTGEMGEIGEERLGRWWCTGRHVPPRPRHLPQVSLEAITKATRVSLSHANVRSKVLFPLRTLNPVVEASITNSVAT